MACALFFIFQIVNFENTSSAPTSLIFVHLRKRGPPSMEGVSLEIRKCRFDLHGKHTFNLQTGKVLLESLALEWRRKAGKPFLSTVLTLHWSRAAACSGPDYSPQELPRTLCDPKLSTCLGRWNVARARTVLAPWITVTAQQLHAGPNWSKI